MGWGWGRAGKAGGVGRRLLFYFEAALKGVDVRWGWQGCSAQVRIIP